MNDTNLTRDERIWQAVYHIPEGKVATYGQIAEMVGLPGYARQVGYALHRLPKGSKIPWHRVINRQGKISLPEDSPFFKRQRKLLEHEGIYFIKGKISLKEFQWKI